ncbi:hypothetical protein O8C83_05180 [Aliarcobacter butzleri]|uniref:hypothetical protein n=1 Tax=Aliarcobacter butzleri TaxID=28197 RepID=UPI00063B07A1|nr:hypothetical protein [Aliarcobacter butzleri]KLE08927.1 hypothetical protein AF79_07320 [Aliarcobacter butzleri L354]MDN5100206.1 hypothetical protein [Aliarcobacter butzleri]
MASLNEIRVLVIDDQDTNISAIIRGLCTLGLNLKNMYPNDRVQDEVREFSSFVKQSANRKNIVKIYQKIKEYIDKEKIDILFLDLNLTGQENSGETSGEELIELLINSDEPILTYLPIAVVSQYSHVRAGISRMAPIVHILKDDTGFTRDKFAESCEEIRLIESLPLIVQNYRKIKNSEDYNLDVKYIKAKLNSLNYDDKLDNILGAINDLNENNLSSNEKLKNIEIMNKVMIKTLPLLCENKNVKKVIEEISEDKIKELLGSEFPEELGKSLYSKIKAVASKERDDLANEVMNEIKNEVKEHISSQANIKDNDNVIEKTGKLSLYLWNQVASVATGNL